jgi:hypothetical protein
MGVVERRPVPNGGKAVVRWEETGPCPTGATGGGVHARRDRCAEITPGRPSSPQGLTATCTDLVSAGIPEARGGGRTDAGARRSDDGGVTPADGVRETTTSAVTPGSCKGALGTWPLQEYPDTVGPGNNGAPVEANQRGKGCRWVSTSASRSLGRRPPGGHGQNRTGESPPSGIAGGHTAT